MSCLFPIFLLSLALLRLLSRLCEACDEVRADSPGWLSPFTQPANVGGPVASSHRLPRLERVSKGRGQQLWPFESAAIERFLPFSTPTRTEQTLNRCVLPRIGRGMLFPDVEDSMPGYCCSP